MGLEIMFAGFYLSTLLVLVFFKACCKIYIDIKIFVFKMTDEK